MIQIYYIKKKKIKVCAVCVRKVLKHVRKARHSCGGSK